MRIVLNLLLTGMALTAPAWANPPGEGFTLNAGITEVAPRNFSVIVVQDGPAQEAAAAKLHRHLPNALAKLNHHIGEHRLQLEDWIQGNRPGDLHWMNYRRREGLVIIRSEALDSAPEARNRVIGFCRPGGIDRDKPHSLYAEIVICSKLLGPDGNPDQLDHTLLHELMHFLGLDLTFKLPAAAVAGPDGMVVQVHGPGGSACATLMTTRLQPEPEEGDGQVNGCRTQ
jgi:hypothetical protein